MHLLKEWDVVCRALEKGRQILLARKGGILDDGGRFVPAHPEFFLFPTVFHESEQQKDSLKPSERTELPETPVDAVRLRVFCRVTDVQNIADESKLRPLEDEHIWTTKFLEKRFEGGSERGLTLLLVRAYRLEREIVLPMQLQYAGCKSWVDVEDCEMPPLNPALSDEEFQDRRTKILNRL
jgi:hypothetical protein